MKRERPTRCSPSNIAAPRAATEPAPSAMLLPPAERLVGFGFRCWLTGYATGDIACWEAAWTAYSADLGPKAGRAALDDLAHWVRTIRACTSRDIQVSAPGCAGFCQDECMAISMVAACQHDACPALKACAFALIESSAIAPVVARTEAFAATLKTAGRVLSPAFVPLVAGSGDGAAPVGAPLH